MIVHCLGPIDDWVEWTELVAEGEDALREFAEFCHLAGLLGWDGIIREGPFLTMLPGTDPDQGYACSRTRAIALKQDNNGTTFVGTYDLLPWLFREYGGEAYVKWDRPQRPPPVIRRYTTRSLVKIVQQGDTSTPRKANLT